MPAPPTLLLMTRPAGASKAFLDALQEAEVGPVEPIVSPLIGIRWTGALPDLDGVDALVFTSVNGVEAYRALGGPPGLRAFTVGRATAEAAARAGLQASSAGGDADALVAMIVAGRAPGRLLHLRGTHGRGAVAERLTRAGVPASEAVIYDQPARPPSEAALAALSGTRPVVAPLFSPRTAAILAGLPIKAPILVAAMSEAVAKATAPLHSRATGVAARPDQDAMVACTAELVARARELETPRGPV
jgi:uroporphyrinogen-III synthase